MKTVAGIHSGYTDNLLLRAADVTLKERRKLILVARECPFNTIHLRNLYELSQMSVEILPPMLTYYNHPQNGCRLHDLHLGRGYATCRQCRNVHGTTSLTGSGVGVTSSVLNGIGHKDEYVARKFAEAAAEKFVCTAVCSCGIHIDGITPAQLQEVSVVDKLLKQVIAGA